MSNYQPEAETLYDLCEQVAQAIETKPGNYFQELWVTPVKFVAITSQGSSGEKTYREACGTAYCRAGWMVTLAEPVNTPNGSGSIHNKAMTLLLAAGIPHDDIAELFHGGANGSSIPGTPEYVEKGAKGMRNFAVKHETKLKAVKLKDLLNDNGTVITKKRNNP